MMQTRPPRLWENQVSAGQELAVKLRGNMWRCSGVYVVCVCVHCTHKATKRIQALVELELFSSVILFGGVKT